MPKNIGLYNDNLSVPRKKDIDVVYADTVHLSEQTLTDDQKQQARTNIGAKSDFVVNLTVTAPKTVTSDKTPKEMYDAYTAGNTIVGIITWKNFDLRNGSELFFCNGVTVDEYGSTKTYMCRFNKPLSSSGRKSIEVVSIYGYQDEENSVLSDTVDWEFNDVTTYNSVLKINVNNKAVAKYTPGSSYDETADITVPTKASDIGALPDTTDYVSYTEDSTVEDVTNINADLLQGHNAAYFATVSDVLTLSSTVTTVGNSVNTLNTKVTNNSNSIDGMQEDISILQNKVIEKMGINGGTMTGELIAQNNANYTTAQVRNIIISAAAPSGGGNGDIWLRYTE